MPNLCWSCHNDPGGGHFCGHCQKIQPFLLGSDYFVFMETPRKTGFDPELLEKKFYDLSRKFHPDFFQGKSDKERMISLEKSSFLNKAYDTLKDPMTRVEYLLSLEVPSTAKERTKVDPALVFEIFKIQEMVEEEKQTKDPALKSELEDAKKEVEGKIEERRKSLDAYFKQWDLLENALAQKQELAKTIRKTIDEMSYLKNVIQSIETGGQIRH